MIHLLNPEMHPIADVTPMHNKEKIKCLSKYINGDYLIHAPFFVILGIYTSRNHEWNLLTHNDLPFFTHIYS